MKDIFVIDKQLANDPPKKKQLEFETNVNFEDPPLIIASVFRKPHE